MNALLVVSALVELGAGVGMLLAPGLLLHLLLGGEAAGATALVGRWTGVALLALGVACWSARRDSGSRAPRGLIVAMLVYNVGAVAILAAAGTLGAAAGALLWPAVALHLALGAWCIAALARKASGPL